MRRFIDKDYGTQGYSPRTIEETRTTWVSSSPPLSPDWTTNKCNNSSGIRRRCGPYGPVKERLVPTSVYLPTPPPRECAFPYAHCSLFTFHRFALKQGRMDNDLAVIISRCCDQVASAGRAVQFGSGNVADIVLDVVRCHAPFASRRRWQSSHGNRRQIILIKELSSNSLGEKEGENRSWSPFCALPSASIIPSSSQPLRPVETEHSFGVCTGMCGFYLCGRLRVSITKRSVGVFYGVEVWPILCGNCIHRGGEHGEQCATYSLSNIA